VQSVIVKELYTAEVRTTGGRAGHTTSSDGILDLDLARPGSSRGTNPEQLLAAGWSACFQSALAHAGRTRGIDTSASMVTAKVTLGNEADGGYALKASLRIQIPGIELQIAQELVEEAHRTCPYSKATRGNIDASVEAIS